MKWTCDKTGLGYLLVFKTPQGEIWFKPTEYGHVRSIHSTAIGLSFDLQRLAVIGDEVKAAQPFKRFGSKLSQDRGNFCAHLCAALNEAKLFPARKDAG